jgi:DNA-binding MarR family transcriptional regulator
MKPIPTSIDLDSFLPYRLSVASNRLSSAIARLYADRFDLTIPEWRVMAVLGRFGPMTAGELTWRTAMDKVRISRAVARLATAGRLTADTDDTDRRRRTLTLTDVGRRVHAEIVPLALACEAEVLDRLPADGRARLDRTLRELEEVLTSALPTLRDRKDA